MPKTLWTTMNAWNCSLLFLSAAPAVSAQSAVARTEPLVFHVDAERGQDEAAGTTPESAWRSLGRVNGTPLIPGDTVRFRRGGLWRGSLLPQSGSPERRITYAAYGEGAKPILQGSTPRQAEADWEEVGPGLWATLRPEYTAGEPVLDLRRSDWGLHYEAGAKATLTQAAGEPQRLWHLRCEASGTAANHIQLWGPVVPAKLPPIVLLRLRWRSSVAFTPGTLAIRRNGPPWTTYASAAPDSVTLTSEWQTDELVLRCRTLGDQARLHLYLGGRLPPGALLEMEPLGLWAATCNQEEPLVVDVGNLIFDHGQACGTKKWSMDQLRAPGDYLYDGPGGRVVLRAERNPAQSFRSLELALSRHIISQGGVHDVTYQDLALRYGAAHGIGGGNTARVTVRQCDVSYIGGAHQFTPPGGKPVRYGNGIEFWGGAQDNLVEGCRLWEIYDAALTNQGSGVDSRQVNVTYRHNVIWNAEYSFEYWNRPAEAVTEHILFENNTCVDAGFGWAHGQRPDRNGAHLMLYHNSARTVGFTVRNNVFCRSTEVCLRLDNDWRAGLTVDHNLWYQEEKPMVRFLVKQYYGAADLERYRQEVGLDAHSAVAQPQFRAAEKRDYELVPGSPGTVLAHDGGPVGARP